MVRALYCGGLHDPAIQETVTHFNSGGDLES